MISWWYKNKMDETEINEEKLRRYMKEIISLTKPENDIRVRELLDLMLTELERIAMTFQDKFTEFEKRLKELRNEKT